MGYDAMYVTRDAIERAGSANPQAINDELKNTENFPGVTGTFSFDELHNRAYGDGQFLILRKCRELQCIIRNIDPAVNIGIFRSVFLTDLQ